MKKRLGAAALFSQHAISLSKKIKICPLRKHKEQFVAKISTASKNTFTFYANRARI